MERWQERTAVLLGEATLDSLAAKRVMVVGLGGVGPMRRRCCAVQVLEIWCL